MAKFRNLKNSLIAGEISPTAQARNDLQQYVHACKTMKNVIPILSGGAYRRPGTFFETDLNATSEYAPRIIPFVVSKTESYCLLFGRAVGSGTAYTRVFRPTQNSTLSTEGTFTGSHPYTVVKVADYFTKGSYDEIHDVQFAQSADIMYLAHPKYAPRLVARSAVDTFSIVQFDNGYTGTTYRDCRPYRAQNTTSTTLAISSASVGTGRTLTASAALFSPLHVGAVFKINTAGTIGCVLVTGYTDSQHVTVEVKVALGGTAAVATWWESSWSDYRGWPRTVELFQQRLCYGGNASEPDTIWLSQSSNYSVFSVAGLLQSTAAGDGSTTGPTGSQPFAIQMSSRQLNQIQWLSSDKTLTAGTLGDEYIVEREVDTAGFGCDNAKATPQSHYGSSYHQPARFGDELVFSTASDDELKSLVYNELESTYSAEPVQILFDHYPKAEVGTSNAGNKKFKAFQWDGSRDTLWCIDTAGNLFGMTRDRKLQLSMWHTHQLGGYDSTVTGGSLGSGVTKTADPAYYVCAGSVLSLAVVPNPVIGMNDLWLVVKRKISGVWHYHLERMIGSSTPFETSYISGYQHTEGGYMVDAAVFSLGDYPLAEDYSFSGLDHIKGETPQGTAINSRGIVTVTGSAVDNSGVTTLTSHPANMTAEPTAVSLGLPYSSVIIPVKVDAGSQVGTAFGAVARIHELTLKFYKTLSCKVGRDADNLETLIFREGSTPMGYGPDLFTGDKTIPFSGDYDRENQIYVLQDKPLPFTLVAIIAEGNVND